MDSTKIFIDTDNEITFILEKIIYAKDERVCLVIPDRASIFNSVPTLKLLKRVIDKSDKLVVIVTLDPNGYRLAQKVGFVVVSRIGEINNTIWEEAQKKKFEAIKQYNSRTYYIPSAIEEVVAKPNKQEKDEEQKPKLSLKDLINNDLERYQKQTLSEDNEITEAHEEITDTNIVFLNQPNYVEVNIDQEIEVDSNDIEETRSTQISNEIDSDSEDEKQSFDSNEDIPESLNKPNNTEESKTNSLNEEDDKENDRKNIKIKKYTNKSTRKLTFYANHDLFSLESSQK